MRIVIGKRFFVQRTRHWCAWLVSVMFFLYEFLLRAFPGAFQATMAADFHLNSTEFAALSTTAFFVVYAIMQIPVGFLISRFGLRWCVLSGIALCALGGVGMAITDSYGVALCFRLLNGLGASFGFIGALVVIDDYLPKRYFGTLIGLTQTCGSLGAMFFLGPMLHHISNDHVGWRSILLGLGVFGCVLWLLAYCLLPLPSEEVAVERRNNKLSNALVTLYLRSIKIIKQPGVVSIMLCTAIAYFAIEYFTDVEGRHFMMLKGIMRYAASNAIFTGWVGYSLGCVVWGAIADLTNNLWRLIWVAAWLGLMALVMIANTNSAHVLQVAFFFLGCSCSVQAVGFMIIAHHLPAYDRTLGYAANNAMITLFSSVVTPILGVILDLRSLQRPVTLVDYQVVVGVLAMILLVNVLISFRHARAQHSNILLKVL